MNDMVKGIVAIFEETLGKNGATEEELKTFSMLMDKYVIREKRHHINRVIEVCPTCQGFRKVMTGEHDNETYSDCLTCKGEGVVKSTNG